MTAANIARVPFAALIFCWSVIVGAQIPVPPLTRHIIDQTSTLSGAQITAIDQTLQTLEARKGSQLAVLIVASTAPETIEQYALRVAEQWKLGRKKIDDGAILLVAKSDRVVRIEVGYGLEGALNDATSKRIISEIITPHFKQGDYYGGISTGLDQIIRVVDGEPLPTPSSSLNTNAQGIGKYTPIVFILALVLGGILRTVLGRFPSALVTGGAVGVIAWLFAGALPIALGAGFMALVFTLLSGTSGMLGGFGTGGSGGVRGGGFGGGGGGFGGGGASGRW